MKMLPLPALLLRGRLLMMRAGAVPCAALVLCLSGLGAWAWLLPQRAALAQLSRLTRQAQALQAAPRAGPAAPPAASGAQNLALFYAALGARGDTEQQLRILFALAARSGLRLNQGEYKFGYDHASRLSTYEIVLPVRGAYQSIWQFSLQALCEIPFAALDEINFRRDSISDAEPEARLRLTLYLTQSAQPVLGQP